MKASYRFVHLSDIHFGQERSGDVVVHDDAREMLLRDCAVLREQLGAADGIIVTGDSAYSGSHEEYTTAGDWLVRLAKTVGCEPIAVRVIPGTQFRTLSSSLLLELGVTRKLHERDRS